MTRFFFDRTADRRPRYDFCGLVLSDVEQARARAELLAMDLSCCETEPPTTSVEVRDVKGRTLISVPLPQAEDAAA